MKLFKLKRKNIILVSLLAIAGFLGISSVAVNTATSKEAPVAEKAEADTGVTFRLYLDATSTWNHDSAKFVARASGTGVTTKNFGFSNVSGNLFHVDIDTGYTNVTFYRVSNDQYNDLIQWNYEPGSQGGNVGQYWNRAVGGSRSSKNRFNISDYSSGSWIEYKILNSGETIHLKTGGKDSGWATDDANMYAWVWMTNGCQWVTVTWNESEGFYTFTLPGNSTGFTLVRQDPNQTPRSGTSWGESTTWNQSDVTLNSTKTLLDVTTTGSIGDWGYFANSYIYYINDDSGATGNYVYTWGSSNYYGAWPGTQITSVEGVTTVQGDVKFNGSTNVTIYKIPYSTYCGDTGVKFRGGDDSWQTADFTLSSGAAYIWSDSVSGPYTDRGAAIDLIIREEALRKSATNQSICNISKSNCASLYSTYNSLSSNAKSFVNNSFTLTYPSSSTSATKVDVSLEKVFYQIGINGGSISKSMFTGLSLFGSEDNFSTIIIIISSSVALLSVTALSILVIRKRKSKED